jgi:hypothetical protein
MCARWADNEQKSESLVEVLLTPVRNQFVNDDQGGVAGYNFGAYNEYLSAIESYIKLNTEIPESKKFELLSNAVWTAAKDKKLDAKNLLKYVKDEEGKYLSKLKENYEFVSSISVNYFEGLKRNNLNPPIKFAQKKPKKFDFESILKPISYIAIKEIPRSYTFFRIPVAARNPMEAYHQGIDAIDLLRAIWNWFYKPQEYIFNSDQSRKPMNFITLGSFHTILKPDGKFDGDFWYEPEFREAAIDIRKDWDKLNSFEQKSRRAISRHPYKHEIENALRRFTRALDHSDKHVSFLQLWQVLEKITDTNNANYEQLIKRVAFLHEEIELNKGVLNHLRLYRNSSVHDGIQHNRIEKYLYQLKRYVEEVLGFHVNNPFKANSLADAVSYLDLPADDGTLRKRFTQTKEALKFRRIK